MYIDEPIYEVHKYDKIAQFSIHPVININLIERSLSNTNRGDQGYGSSGY